MQNKGKGQNKTIFAKPVILQGNDAFLGAITPIDVDLDGVKDLVLGRTFSIDPKGPFQVFLLSSKFKVRRKTHLAPTKERGLLAYKSMRPIDLNGDGILDLFSISSKGGISPLIFQGLKVPAKDKEEPLFAAYSKFHRMRTMANRGISNYEPNAVEVVDLDGDGKKEVLLVGDVRFLWDTIDSSGVVILDRNAQGAFFEKVLLPGSFKAMRVGDLDGDGDPDIVVLGKNNKMIILKNQGKRRFIRSDRSIAFPSHASRLALGDMNGDGFLDFIIGGGTKKPELAWFPGNKNGFPGSQNPINQKISPTYRIETILSEDFDGDGKQEFAVFSAKGQGQIDIFKLGTKKMENIQSIPLTHLNLIPRLDFPLFLDFMQASDLDGDGNKELILSTATLDSSKGKGVAQTIIPNIAKTPNPTKLLGSGVVGKNGLLPKITVWSGKPVRGETAYRVGLSHVPGNKTWVTLWIAGRRTPLRMYGMNWEMFPSTILPVQTKGIGPGSGLASAKMNIPYDKRLTYIDYYLQWLVIDNKANNPLGIAFSQVLRTRIK
jgi:hypothetical protein